MLDLWLIRHGQSTWNAERRIQGISDPPLTELGKMQAQRLAHRLHGESFDHVHASDLERAVDTARLALPGREAMISTHESLREIHLGAFEGRLHADLTNAERDAFEVWFRGPFDRRVTGGESSDDLRLRVGGWLERLPSEGRIAVFSHGGAIGAMLQHFLGRPGQGAYTWGVRIENTAITRLSIDAGAVLVEVVNDASHLRD